MVNTELTLPGEATYQFTEFIMARLISVTITITKADLQPDSGVERINCCPPPILPRSSTPNKENQ